MDFSNSTVFLYPHHISVREMLPVLRDQQGAQSNGNDRSPSLPSTVTPCKLWVDYLSCSTQNSVPTPPSCDLYRQLATNCHGISLLLSIDKETKTLDSIVVIYLVYFAAKYNKPLKVYFYHMVLEKILEDLNEEVKGKSAYQLLGLPHYQEEIYYAHSQYEELLEDLLEEDCWINICGVVYEQIYSQLLQYRFFPRMESLPASMEGSMALIDRFRSLYESSLAFDDDRWLRPGQQLALLLIRKARYEESKDIMQRSYNYYVQRYSLTNRFSLFALQQLCVCRINLFDYESDLEKTLQLLIKTSRDLYDGGHRHYFYNLYLLAVFYYDVGRYSEAETAFLLCLNKQQVILGEDHAHTLETLYKLAYNFNIQKKYMEASIYFKKYLNITQVVYGLSYANAIQALLHLANVYGILGEIEESIYLYDQLIAHYILVYGYHHENTLECQQKLAELYIKVGRKQEAELLLFDCLQHMNFLRGENHPRSQQFRQAYEDILIMNMEGDSQSSRQAIVEDRITQELASGCHGYNFTGLRSLFYSMTNINKKKLLVEQLGPHPKPGSSSGSSNPHPIIAVEQPINNPVIGMDNVSPFCGINSQSQDFSYDDEEGEEGEDLINDDSGLDESDLNDSNFEIANRFFQNKLDVEVLQKLSTLLNNGVEKKAISITPRNGGGGGGGRNNNNNNPLGVSYDTEGTNGTSDHQSSNTLSSKSGVSNASSHGGRSDCSDGKTWASSKTCFGASRLPSEAECESQSSGMNDEKGRKKRLQDIVDQTASKTCIIM
eukprot:scaffold2831_cov249-Ochromonas_danica.AAC.19